MDYLLDYILDYPLEVSVPGFSVPGFVVLTSLALAGWHGSAGGDRE